MPRADGLVRGFGRQPGVGGVDVEKGVQGGVALLDAVKQDRDEVHGRELARAEGFRQLGHGRIDRITSSHVVSSQRSRCALRPGDGATVRATSPALTDARSARIIAYTWQMVRASDKVG